MGKLVGSNGDFIKKKIIFAPPPHDAVVNIINIKNDVIVESAEVVEEDYVLVKGHLNKSIVYNTTKRDMLIKLMGKKCGEKEEDCDKEKEDKDHKRKDCDEEKEDKKHKKEVICESIVMEPKAIALDGVVRHTTVWIPFNILIKVEGAKIGDKVHVTAIDLQKLNKQCDIEEIIEDCLIVGMFINDVINVTVKVKESSCPCE